MSGPIQVAWALHTVLAPEQTLRVLLRSTVKGLPYAALQDAYLRVEGPTTSWSDATSATGDTLTVVMVVRLGPQSHGRVLTAVGQSGR